MELTSYPITRPENQNMAIDECIDKYMIETGVSRDYLKQTGITVQEFSHITNIPSFMLLQDIFDEKLPAYRLKNSPTMLWINFYKGLTYYYERLLTQPNSE